MREIRSEREALLKDRNAMFLLAEMEDCEERLTLLKQVPLKVSTLMMLSDAPANIDCSLTSKVFVDYAREHESSAEDILRDAFSDPFYLDMYLQFFDLPRSKAYMRALTKPPALPYIRVLRVRERFATEDLRELERRYHVLDLLLWLSLRFGHSAAEHSKMENARDRCTELIADGLRHKQVFRRRKPSHKGQHRATPTAAGAAGSSEAAAAAAA
mmetsp:Transcript_24859/g.70278  ORF Transcript_24859/g.70278 Transcript_24859/m.70278 type:complete len:214 (+) Transcript_24859:263-904(+)